MRKTEHWGDGEGSRTTGKSSPREAKVAPRKPAVSPLRSVVGNRETQKLFAAAEIHAKLRVSQPGDADELEADHVAEQVAAGPTANDRATGTAGSSFAPGIQPSASDRPLDPSVRNDMENELGHNFSGVRIHNDSQSSVAADSLNARAFTVGNDIVFARGEYAPQSVSGKKLLAHELAHVVQQSRTSTPKVQRSPDVNPKQIFDTGGARDKDIDKLIANSNLKKYMTKDWKTLAGNYEYIDPASFEAAYDVYSKKKSVNRENVDEVPGFVDRTASPQIKLRRPGTSDQPGKKSLPVSPATVEAAIHETVHINSAESFQADFTHATNEGVTEYFTEMAMGKSGNVYRDQLNLATGLIAALGSDGERLVAEAFFGGKRDLYQKIVQPALSHYGSGSYTEWREALHSDPPDSKKANELLMAALANFRKTGKAIPDPKPVPPSGAGSGSIPGRGSG